MWTSDHKETKLGLASKRSTAGQHFLWVLIPLSCFSILNAGSLAGVAGTCWSEIYHLPSLGNFIHKAFYLCGIRAVGKSSGAVVGALSGGGRQ